MPRRTNGKSYPSLKAAVSSLHVQDTELLELGSIWVELAAPNPANQSFRASIRKLKDQLAVLQNVDGTDISAVIDDEGNFSNDVIEVIHAMYIEDWGGYNDAGERCPLYDEDGEVAECTLENFKAVVCDMEGGGDLFMAIQKHIATMADSKAMAASAEKNSSNALPAPSASAASRPTRKGRKRAAA